MMNLDVTALRESFALVVSRAPDLTHRFYDELFRRYPEAARLFGRNTRQKQEEMLTRALVAVVDHVEEPSWMRETLHAMGAKHVGYGVTDEMYDWVGEALLVSLADVAAEAWSPRAEAAWRAAYSAIAGLMLDGARRARAEARTSGQERRPEAH
jgi:hemoglobin-like flavoprotein